MCIACSVSLSILGATRPTPFVSPKMPKDRAVAEAFKAGSAPDIVLPAFPRSKSFVFVGLNALNECERFVMKRLQDARLAEFCWDYCGEMIRDKSNRSSFFMEDNVARFPMNWKLEPIEAKPQVNVVAVPSATGQAKLLSGMIGYC